MFNICVFHSNRLPVPLACEGQCPNRQKRLPGEESCVVPLRRSFLCLFSNNPHQTLLAVKCKTEPAAVARYNIERLFISRRPATLSTPPHAVLYAMFAEHDHCTIDRLQLKGWRNIGNAMLLVEEFGVTVRHISAIVE